MIQDGQSYELQRIHVATTSSYFYASSKELPSSSQGTGLLNGARAGFQTLFASLAVAQGTLHSM